MKAPKSFFIIFALLMVSFVNAPSPLTKSERKFATKLLRQSKEDLIKVTKGLSTMQLNFKPDAVTWSVAECVEHIALSENIFSASVRAALQVPAEPQKRNKDRMSDEAIVEMITDRSYRVKTSEPFVPSGKFGSFDATVKEFVARRNNHIHYIQHTSVDLRSHYHEFPFGELDAYQIIIFMAGHSQRHTEQIKALMARPDFPND